VGTSASATGWPHTFVLRDTNQGVSSFVKATEGSIGYSVYAEALHLNHAVARLKKGDVLLDASADTVEVALAEQAHSLLGDDEGAAGHLTTDLYTATVPPARVPADGLASDAPACCCARVPGSSAWPISGLTYIVMRKSTLRQGQTCAGRRQAVEFWRWFYRSEVVLHLARQTGFASLPASIRTLLAGAEPTALPCRHSVVAVRWRSLRARAKPTRERPRSVRGVRAPAPQAWQSRAAPQPSPPHRLTRFPEAGGPVEPAEKRRGMRLGAGALKMAEAAKSSKSVCGPLVQSPKVAYAGPGWTRWASPRARQQRKRLAKDIRCNGEQVLTEASPSVVPIGGPGMLADMFSLYAIRYQLEVSEPVSIQYAVVSPFNHTLDELLALNVMMGVASSHHLMTSPKVRVRVSGNGIPKWTAARESSTGLAPANFTELMALPVVGIGFAVVFNALSLQPHLRGEPLVLDVAALVAIFSGAVRSWGDPALSHMNPGLAALNASLEVVGLEQNTDDADIFAALLRRYDDRFAWQGMARTHPSHELVRADVMNSPFTIGFVPFTEGTHRLLGLARMRKGNGTEVPLSAASVAACAKDTYDESSGLYDLAARCRHVSLPSCASVLAGGVTLGFGLLRGVSRGPASRCCCAQRAELMMPHRAHGAPPLHLG
ncbi:hypothetical protein CYMTET_8502, partial [Cymbomonas tetramitiformis]